MRARSLPRPQQAADSKACLPLPVTHASTTFPVRVRGPCVCASWPQAPTARARLRQPRRQQRLLPCCACACHSRHSRALLPAPPAAPREPSRLQRQQRRRQPLQPSSPACACVAPPRPLYRPGPHAAAPAAAAQMQRCAKEAAHSVSIKHSVMQTGHVRCSPRACRCLLLSARPSSSTRLLTRLCCAAEQGS